MLQPHYPIVQTMHRGEDLSWAWNLPDRRPGAVVMERPFYLKGFLVEHCLRGKPMGESWEEEQKKQAPVHSSSIVTDQVGSLSHWAIFARELWIGLREGFPANKAVVFPVDNFIQVFALRLLRFDRPIQVHPKEVIWLTLSKLSRCITDETELQVSLLGQHADDQGMPE